MKPCVCVYSPKPTRTGRRHETAIGTYSDWRVCLLQKLVALKWKRDKSVFESEQLEVAGGLYKCTMLLSGRELQVEPLDIKFYTFESDIYLPESKSNI